MPEARLDDEQPATKQLQKYADNQSDKIKTTSYVTTGLTFVARCAGPIWCRSRR